MKPYIVLLISAFCVYVGAATRVVDKTAVIVNDDVVLESDIDKFIEKMRSKSSQEMFGGIDEKILANRKAVLQLLVEEKIISQQVKKLDLQSNDQEVDGQIKSISKRNGISDAQLAERLKQLGTSIKDYKDGIRRQLERKNLIDREIKPSMEITEDQVRHFYMRTLKPGESDTEYKIAQILISSKGSSAATAEGRASKIYAEINKAPQDFEKLHKEYSDDASSTESGGSLGFFTTASLSKEFKDVVPKLAVGQISKPFKTKIGFHILKLLEKRQPDFASISKERKESLRIEMISSELEKKMALWLERKKAESYIREYKESK